ncbi:Utp21 specific WD40 associated domain protein [Necator americanus]|uniref:Utp21 specific WD40 associated domain protein n=1 Tax=Necator americanus TaxID=51031 RepID=W2SL90_NECAM|nr:Utp21 specific WD40 associated domain protein [Necator americanus]ETN70288.1 Utp21 specific WD40 associated domain protein [Necator americanus]
MTTADIGGDIVVWDLEKRQLIGKISHVHHAAVTELYFMPGEPVMVSASADNSLRTWVLDGADGMPRQLVILEGHAEGVTAVQFNGKQELVHKRFTKDASLSKATATAIALSPCGNFAFIGYSTGHVDQFNIQSGRHVKTFAKQADQEGEQSEKENSEKAHDSKITALVVDSRGSELITGCYSGKLKYWQARTGKLLATMRTRLRIERSAPCTANSLLAVACIGDEGASVAVVDTLCRRVVRTFSSVGGSVNAMTFSSDGRWLLTADNSKYIRVWELSTSQLIDVMLFDRPCIGMSFNNSGEYLATIHEDEKSIFIWANKKMYASHVNIRALPLDYLPTWKSHVPEVGVNTFVIDDESEEWASSEQIDSSLVTYSGLAPSRWANLPDLALIKERNKPEQPPRKPKQAPFFLTAAPTLEGFEFEVPQEDQDERRRTLQAKRSLLELESSFSSMLRAATSSEDLQEVFQSLKKMSVSAIDFQLRTLPAVLLTKFFKMLTEILKTRRDFDLVQAYLATALKIHRSALWQEEDDAREAEQLTNALEELSLEQERIWSEYDKVMVENAAVTQWVKNALI